MYLCITSSRLNLNSFFKISTHSRRVLGRMWVVEASSAASPALPAYRCQGCRSCTIFLAQRSCRKRFAYEARRKILPTLHSPQILSPLCKEWWVSHDGFREKLTLIFVHWFVYRGHCSRRDGACAAEMRWSGLRNTGVWEQQRNQKLTLSPCGSKTIHLW